MPPTNGGLPKALDDQNWREFTDDGLTFVGRLDPSTLRSLRANLDDIMLGRADVPYDHLLMQLDSSSGDYGDLGRQTHGFKGATLRYRKIQDLELTPAFRAYAELPLFRTICRHIHQDIPIACFRAMAMIKPAAAGTKLPWHQDRWHYLDRDPAVTIWTALDDANAHSGGLEVIPGSHRLGIVNPKHPSAFLTDAQQAQCNNSAERRIHDSQAGEVWLLHNWLIHRSGIDATDNPRRAFSVAIGTPAPWTPTEVDARDCGNKTPLATAKRQHGRMWAWPTVHPKG